MARFNVLFVVASFVLFLAFLACGISFFGPFWLGNVTSPWMRSAGGAEIESNLSYIVPAAGVTAKDYSWRGLWAQCSVECQWFWENDYSLEHQKFYVLRWHLAVQILYFIGAFLVLFCEIYTRVILCCDPRLGVYRSIGFILLTAFVIQAAAIAVFGGFANRDYGAVAFVHQSFAFLGWCFWMAVAGGGLTVISGILFLLLECVDDLDEEFK